MAQFGRDGCHKIEKRRPLALSKAGRRWYIPPAPAGHMAPGLPSQEALGTEGSARLPRWPTPFRRRFSRKGAQWLIAGWSSPVARQAHNLKVASSNLAPATKQQALEDVSFSRAFCCSQFGWKFCSWKRRGSGGTKVAAQNRRGRDDSIVIASLQRAPQLVSVHRQGPFEIFATLTHGFTKNLKVRR